MPNLPADSVTGIYETHLSVRDLQTSLAFYRDTLGFEVAREIPDRRVAFLWVGGKDNGMLGLWEGGAGPLGMRLHFAFRMPVESVLKVPDQLRATGLQPLGFSGEAVSEPVVIGWMPAVSVYVKDPDGHSIEFLSILNDTPDPDFGIGPYSSWLSR